MYQPHYHDNRRRDNQELGVGVIPGRRGGLLASSVHFFGGGGALPCGRDWDSCPQLPLAPDQAEIPVICSV